MRSNKNWRLRVLKWVDHDQMVTLRTYMPKIIDLNNMLISIVYFIPMDA